ncbi:dna-directed rna polymerase [Ophiostoma piceae UAMH 11346]|uniref:DNA-directed RNA polymerase n=1 Tax=Ophiostoma piceae (strain UAMH 11346) TaxID=1262450 RepID=S3C470_OPHP1|nr:dna-directed rna polymerase [Ophiostoma piceae UAMH 11346]
MFVRPAGGGQTRTAALRRLQSSSALFAQPPRSPLLSPSTSTSSPWASPLRPLGFNRRLLSSSSSSSPARPGLRSWRPQSSQSERSLATAVGDYLPNEAASSLGPISSVAAASPSATHSGPAPSSQAAASASSRLSHLYASSSSPSPLWELRPHNVSSPLVIEEAPEPAKRQKVNNRGIPGDSEEMLSILDACLKVGNLERAALVLKRLSIPQFASADIDIPELQSRFLYASVDALIETPTVPAAEKLHKWFELEIGGGRQAVSTSPENIALMLKASLLTARGVTRERLIERYMGMATGDAGLEVLHMTDILNDQDRAAITDIYRDYNLEPTHDELLPDTPTLFEQALKNIEGPPVTTSELGEAAAEIVGSAEVDPAEHIFGTIPEVLGTPQKGMGLRTLKKTLTLFGDIPEGRDIASLGLEERRQIQSRLERDCIEAAVDRWAEENDALLKMGLNTSLSTASLNSRLYEWHRDLELRIRQELDKIALAEASNGKTRESFDRCVYGPFLRQAPPSRLAAVTIVSTLSSLAIQGADKGLAIGNAITQIAKVAEEDIRLLQQTSEIRKGILQRNKGKVISKSATKSAKKSAHTKALRHGKKISLPQGEAAELEALKSAEAVAAANAAASRGVQVNEAPEVEGSGFENGEFTVPAIETEPAPADVNSKATNTQTEEELETAQSGTRMPDSWPITIKAKVGAVLLSMMMEAAKVTVVKPHPETGTLISEAQPAFSRINQLKRGKKVGMLIANNTIIDLLKREPRGDFLARHLPMVVEPEPWKGFEKGGFLESPAPLIRVKDSRKDQKLYAEAAIARGDMDQVLKGLDVLGRTAWKVNRPIFEAMLEAWNTGEAIAAIPPIDPQIPIPPEPAKDEDPMKRRTWMKAVKAAENDRSGLHSVRCFMNFQMEIARAFRDQTFYFPHNVDFRGRAYPIPPYFNHMGADHVRGLLIFAKGKKLGDDGLRWLQVHLANVFGYDKASLKDRAQFAVDNLENIRDSACNPLKGQRWWLSAEDPWQCLAACVELNAAYELENPAEFVSHLPVHQDGTCNGLQHYAALGGDSWGAKQVNLEPGDRPADVYSAVADIVKDAIAEDAAKGNETAKALIGKIKRKVVKQTVMTNVYGVTFAGARKQVLKQLDALYPKIEEESGISVMLMSSYIATLIFKALSTMFSGAHDIQSWLGETGGRVCRILMPDQIERIVSGEPEASPKSKAKAKKSSSDNEFMSNFRSTLVWTTPLQMPVVQPYRSAESRVIETCLQDLVLSVPARNDPVNKRKQLQAFPPNFIHSLDASHMLLSALECDALGLQFAAVHDSFWTHASDVNVMNRVLRDAFIRIHSEDVVGRLASEFKARYKGSMLLTKVLRDTPVGKKILALRKAKRMSLKDELVLEWKRLALLNSNDSSLVTKGRLMVTPGSIYAKQAEATGEDSIIETENLAEFSLGQIPEEELKASESAQAMVNSTKSGKVAKPTKSRKKKVTAVDENDIFAALAAEVGEDAMKDFALDADTASDADVDTEAETDAVVDAESKAASKAMDDAEAEAGTKPEPRIKMSEFDASLFGTGHFEAKLRDLKKNYKNRANEGLQVWVPLTFPPIPAKGDFDVSRLKDSDYFFS